MDAVLLARIQFTFTVLSHFVFVPLSIGIGLIMAVFATKYFRSRSPENLAASRFWLKVFTVTFAIGVATGITMEFSFGTNWANYSRYVGDIFGAPLAAEALFAFFLESVFLGILLFGRKRISPRFYCVSAWLVFFASCLSALWILIANSWMQTPAGSEVAADGSKALLTDFFAAAFNSSLGVRYTHTVLAIIVMGAFFALAVAGYYFLKGRHKTFAQQTLKIGCIVAVVSTCLLLVSAHGSAVVVSQEQPTKLAAMEGMYEDGVPPLYLFGHVDEEAEEVLAPFAIEGGTSFLATGAWDTEFEGLNTLGKSERFGALQPSELPVNLIFQSYHLMVAMFGLIALVIIGALVGLRKNKIQNMKWLQKLLIISPIFPFIAIESGWITAEIGRQPWVVYPAVSSPDGLELTTATAISPSVSSTELIITIVLFVVIYVFLIVAWARLIGRFVKEGPVIDEVSADGEPIDMDFELFAASVSRDKKPESASKSSTIPSEASVHVQTTQIKANVRMKGEAMQTKVVDGTADASAQRKGGE